MGVSTKSSEAKSDNVKEKVVTLRANRKAAIVSPTSNSSTNSLVVNRNETQSQKKTLFGRNKDNLNARWSNRGRNTQSDKVPPVLLRNQLRHHEPIRALNRQGPMNLTPRATRTLAGRNRMTSQSARKNNIRKLSNNLGPSHGLYLIRT
jgi:hypothetical protein